MVIVQRETEREGQRRRLEIEREKGGISTSNMTTTQGAGLGGVWGEEGRQGKRRREEGASCGCYVHCGLYLFDPLLFKHRKKEKEGDRKIKEKDSKEERERESKENERKTGAGKKRKLRLNKTLSFLSVSFFSKASYLSVLWLATQRKDGSNGK